MTNDESRAWYAGPAEDPRRYLVLDPDPMPGGQNYVFHATIAEGTGTRHISLKLFDPDTRRSYMPSDEMVEQLRTINHPSLAGVVDSFVGPGLWRTEPPPADEFSLRYIASDWVEGLPLSSAAPMAPAAAAVVIDCVAAAVERLHSEGLVHGDLHPGNVIVTDDGRGVVIDLASVRAVGDGGGPPTGILGFVPPERGAGADVRSDRWNVGALSVYALLGHPKGRQSWDDVAEELKWTLRRSPGGRTVVPLIGAMIADEPDARPVELGAWGRTVRSALQTLPGRRRRLALVAGGVAVVGVAVLAAAVVGIRVSGRHAAPAAPSCGTTFAEENRRHIPGDEFGQAAARLAPDACGDGPITAFGDALYQRFRQGRRSGVIVIARHRAVRLTSAQWASYFEMAGRARPENAILFGGYPTGVRREGASIVIAMSSSGEILGPRADTQSFWMPQQVFDAWKAHGGFARWGYPTSNPYFEPGGLLQDFERGYFEVPHAPVPLEATTAAMVVGHPVADLAAPTSHLGRVTGRILRQKTGTAWYIDDSRRRHWIPDADTWNCLGGDTNVAAKELPGWALTPYPMSSPAHCGQP